MHMRCQLILCEPHIWLTLRPAVTKQYYWKKRLFPSAVRAAHCLKEEALEKQGGDKKKKKVKNLNLAK